MTAESERVVPASEIAPVLDELHARLIASDPDPERLVQVHEFLDIDPDLADRSYPPMPWARKAPGYPDTSSPADFAASVAAGYVTPAYPAADCEPAFAPAPAVEDVETGGRL